MNASVPALAPCRAESDRVAFCPEPTNLLTHLALYQEYVAEREEILKHKWIESEKAGGDIGFNAAFVSWIIRHRSKWRQMRRTSAAMSS